jgi:hypothetical protein
MSQALSALVPRKKNVYIAFTILLFLLLAFIAYCLLTNAYPDIFFPVADQSCNSCQGSIFKELPLPFLALSFMGAIIGYYVGGVWWQVLYVEDRRHKHYKSNW